MSWSERDQRIICRECFYKHRRVFPIVKCPHHVTNGFYVQWNERYNRLETTERSIREIPPHLPSHVTHVAMCDPEKGFCRGDECTYAHGRAEQKRWTEVLSHSGHIVSGQAAGIQIPNPTQNTQPPYYHQADLSYSRQNEQHVSPKQTKWYPQKFKERIKRILDITAIKEELTKVNYKKKFYTLTCWEEKRHIERLREKCDQDCDLHLFQSKLKPEWTRSQSSGLMRYGYFSNLSADQIAYATQSSEGAFIVTIRGGKKYEVAVEILRTDYNHSDEKMYIALKDEDEGKLSEIISVHLPKGQAILKKLSVKFEVKHSYFDGLIRAINNISPEIIARIMPSSQDFLPFLTISSQYMHTLLSRIPRDLEINLDDQLSALCVIFFSDSRSPPVIVNGSFGAGKTRLMANATRCLVEDGKNSQKPVRVLICAHHQSSADQYIEEYFGPMCADKRNPWKVKIVRLISTYYSNRNSKFPQYYKRRNKVTDYYKSSRYFVVVTTFLTAPSLFSVFNAGFFTHILLDEGSQSREPEDIAPLCLAAPDTKIVIAGDPYQVGPSLLVLGEEARENGLKYSLLERLQVLYSKCGDQASKHMVFLSTNYRCHKDIVKIPNQLFYKNEIKSFPQYAHPHPDTKFPLLFVCSSLGPTTDSNLEAQLILQQVEKFVHSWPSDWGRRDLTKIGLVTASRTQLVITRRLARQEFQGLKSIHMLTTYGIQGQEFQALFMSATEPVDESGNTTNPTKSPCDPFIFNTVLTRAKSLVVVVGSPLVLLGIEKHMVQIYGEKGKCWSTYMKTCLEEDTFIVPMSDASAYKQVLKSLKNASAVAGEPQVQVVATAAASKITSDISTTASASETSSNISSLSEAQTRMPVVPVESEPSSANSLVNTALPSQASPWGSDIDNTDSNAPSANPPQPLSSLINLLSRPRRNILRWIPKASRKLCRRKLTNILKSVVKKNDDASWVYLLSFSTHYLTVPIRNDKHSLSSIVNERFSKKIDPSTILTDTTAVSSHKKDYVALKVSSKLEEGDFEGAVRLACSDYTLANINEATFTALKEKHPSPHSDSSIPPLATRQDTKLSVSIDEIAHAIKSFPNGAAGGPDGLKPQHLKDMIGSRTGKKCELFLSALASFVELVLSGMTPESMRPLFFGSRLTVLRKKEGEIQPIAVGCTLRRLAAKVAGMKIVPIVARALAPRQLGCGVRNGKEAAIHASRLYLKNLASSNVILKLNFQNPSNSLRRDRMIEAVKKLVPILAPFIHSAYSAPSTLYWEDKRLQSMEGVQQGDPLASFLFCLTIRQLSACSSLKSELCFFYLDHCTLGGCKEDILHDFHVVKREGAKLGLYLDNSKSEIIGDDTDAKSAILSSLPGAQVVDRKNATLLGSAISEDSLSATISKIIQSLKTMKERLVHLSSHDALFLLRHSFAIPELTHNLRTSPCFLSNKLNECDDLLRSIIGNIVKVEFDEDDPAWTQATLPVRCGGLGIRSLVQLAPSAFLASVASCSHLVHSIIPSDPSDSIHKSLLSEISDAREHWSHGHDKSPLDNEDTKKLQKKWYSLKASGMAESLLKSAPDERSRIRLRASSSKESGAWLQALPIRSFGLHMGDSAIHIAVSLRLGSSLKRPLTCHCCRNEVDCFAMHDLNCDGSYHCKSLNEILHHALSSAKISSELKPEDIQSNGERLDGITNSSIPWENEKRLAWKVRLLDMSPNKPGAVASEAEKEMKATYKHIDASYSFNPIAVETTGVFGRKTDIFFKKLSCHIAEITGEKKSYLYLLQRVSMEIQKGNAVSVMGTTE